MVKILAAELLLGSSLQTVAVRNVSKKLIFSEVQVNCLEDWSQLDFGPQTFLISALLLRQIQKFGVQRIYSKFFLTKENVGLTLATHVWYLKIGFHI